MWHFRGEIGDPCCGRGLSLVYIRQREMTGGEHLYWVRCESRQGPVEEAPEMLEAIAASILFDQ